MATPLFNLSGLASGVDTNAIVQGLMQVERNPIVLLNQRKGQAQERVDAWSQITSRFSSLRTTVDDLKTLDQFDKMVKASSSNTDAVEVTATGAAVKGTFAFTVDQLATNHQVVADAAFASSADSVGAGTLTLTVGGVDHTFDTTAGTTVANLAQQINAGGVGVSAQALKVNESTVRLVLTASQTGAASEFTASGTQATLNAFSVGQQGQDAQLTVGSGAGALTVTRATNTVTDLVDGLTLELESAAASPVTVEVERDLDAAVSTVREVVDALNNVMTSINELTSYDAESQTAAPLLGDGTLRSIQSRLVDQVTNVIGSLSGSYSYAASIGIELTAKGEFTLDEARLREALEDDFDAVSRFFARSGTATDGRLSYSFATDDTVAGSYGVVVTQAATQAATTGSLYSAPGADVALQIVNGSAVVDVIVAAGDSLEAAVTKINAALDEAGVSSLRASDSGGAVKLGQLRYGSAGNFTVTGSGPLGLDGSHTAVDVVGTIDGAAATGTGQSLVSASGDSEGLGVLVTATQSEIDGAGGSLDLGAIGYAKGLMGELSGFLDALEGADGTLARASEQHESQIEDIDERIERFEDRLVIREQTLRRQFTAMEQALALMNGQASFLFSGLA